MRAAAPSMGMLFSALKDLLMYVESRLETLSARVICPASESRDVGCIRVQRSAGRPSWARPLACIGLFATTLTTWLLRFISEMTKSGSFRKDGISPRGIRPYWSSCYERCTCTSVSLTHQGCCQNRLMTKLESVHSRLLCVQVVNCIDLTSSESYLSERKEQHYG